MKRITEYNLITTIAEADVLPVVDVSDTSQATSGSTRKTTIEKVADYLRARVETLTNKTLTSPDINGGTIGGADINGGTIGGDTNVVEVLKKVYPVGSIYINATNSANPATLLGFGTWSAFGAGKVMVGIDSGDTDFDTAEETGGAKTHTLTVAELPSHRHSVGSLTLATDSGVAERKVGGADGPDYTGYTGGGNAHNNLQPYIVVYMFKRTA